MKLKRILAKKNRNRRTAAAERSETPKPARNTTARGIVSENEQKREDGGNASDDGPLLVAMKTAISTKLTK